ncbi:GntR family transcriptional regulator [Vallitalea okinawensis]|uniref:GntR family transcriptional regulator n=1 Tax=Vallitalea okinawensis TaxID=2078660 RepID=UPI000CFCD458|nr:LacI family DNA-binding transcriptional regulator [Vallitalea okinawensis]
MAQVKKPLYLQIIEYVKNKIESNEWKQGDQLPTEIELAEKFNVSRITTKRAMEELARDGIIYRKKGRGSFVSENSSVLRATHNQSKIVSIIIPYQKNREEMLDYIKGATDFLNSKGFHLSVHCVENENNEKEAEYLKSIPLQDVSGIIYYPSNVNDDYQYLIPLSIQHYPIVFIDKYFESLPISSVVSDNFNGTYKAMNQLIQKDHQFISFFSRKPIERASSLKERYMAYCQSLVENQIELDHHRIVNGYHAMLIPCDDYEERIGVLANMIKEQLDLGVTAIVTENDIDLVQGIGKLIHEGIKFPDEFTILGFDHMQIPEFFNMKVLSVEQNFYGIGFRAAEMVVESIENNEYINKKEVLPVRIVKCGNSDVNYAGIMCKQ